MSEHLWCIHRSPYLILGDELRFLSGWYQSLGSGRSPSCLPPGYKSTFTYSILPSLWVPLCKKRKKERKKEKCFSHLQASWEQGDGISCWIYLVLHRAQRQCWGKLVCLPAIVCLPFPHPSVWGLGSSVEALEQRDRERKTPPTLYVCKLSGVASVLFHALEKEMATHSSVLAWRIPGTGEPGGLPSLGSHRVGHDWSDSAAAAAAASVLKVAHGCWASATQLCPFSLEARGRDSVLLKKSLGCLVSWVAEEI